jgi:hypothetical protein
MVSLLGHQASSSCGSTFTTFAAGPNFGEYYRFHQPIVYDDGVRPEDIKTVIGVNTTTTGPTPSPAVVLIDDPDHRIYRG